MCNVEVQNKKIQLKHQKFQFKHHFRINVWRCFIDWFSKAYDPLITEQMEILRRPDCQPITPMKLAKINYQFQDLKEGSKKHEFMGGVSFVASGDLWQLPPIYDNMIYDNNNLDGRPD